MTERTIRTSICLPERNSWESASHIHSNRSYAHVTNFASVGCTAKPHISSVWPWAAEQEVLFCMIVFQPLNLFNLIEDVKNTVPLYFKFMKTDQRKLQLNLFQITMKTLTENAELIYQLSVLEEVFQ